MKNPDSPLMMKASLFAVYGLEVSRLLREHGMMRTASQLEGASLSIKNNVSEAQLPESRRDFIHKLRIAQKEVCEAEGICELLTARYGISQNQKETLLALTDELGRLMSASISTASKNLYLDKGKGRSTKR